jgi:hypothetical protein
MSENVYTHDKIPEVLAAFELLLNDSMALDYCGITGKDRKLILNDAAFARESRRIKAGKYIEEIKDINDIVKSLGRSNADDNARVGSSDEDPTKVINLKMKVASMRREMLSLSSNDKESEESESLNIFFIDVTREEFERMLNVEIHEGDSNSKLIGDLEKEAPGELLNKKRKEEKTKTSIPAELAKNTIEYVNEDGDRVIEEVQE